MKRALAPLLLVGLLPLAAVSHAAPPRPGLLAGAAVVDATWHVGASAGQYSSMQDLSDPLASEWDPNLQHVKNAASYGIASRLSVRALVLQNPGRPPVALVKDDNYLAQDMLSRRAAQLLAQHGSKVTYDNLLVSATHDHNSPYYATPAAGVWLFQDAMDLRMLEYQARAIASAVEKAERSARPARLGATTVPFSVFQGNIAGAGVGEDGAPVGYPLHENDHGLTVLRVDGLDHRPIATWVNYAQHGESLDGYDLVSADWLAPFQRYVDRAIGAPVVFAQGAVGSAEGPYEHAYPKGKAPLVSDHGDAVPAIWAHLGYAQAERGTHLLAEAVLRAWRDIGAGRAAAPMSDRPVVAMLTHWVAGPLSHPYPSVSNCRTGPTVDGDPGVPVAGLPDCQRASDAFGQSLPADGLFDALRGAGIPVPANYDAPSFGSVEENLRLKLQAVRIGDVLLASCACEPQSDLIKAIETRTDRVAGNRWDGMDYADQRAVSAAWPGLSVRACFAAAGAWSCPDPRDSTGVARLKVGKDAFAHMQAQLHNPADGWDDPSYTPFANSEPTDPREIKGNFTRRELTPACGYAVSAGLGHTGDYNGYTVSYREYQARDSYRKALTSYGAHTADYMVTRLMAMAQNLRCGTPLPTEPLDALAAADEQRQAAEALALGRLSSAALDGWSAQVPDSAGPARALVQPRSTSRFGAAAFRWVGGDNWTDNPTVVVERRGAGGRWTAFATQDGEVQTVLDQPGGIAASLVDNRTGAQQWTWTASFEAFDAFPRADVAGGQVPDGDYRFVVAGAIHQGGAVTGYRLVSRPFAVRPWTGVTASALAVRNGSVRFTTPVVTYPRTYASPIRFVHDDKGGLPGADSVICKTCTFRPWATHGRVVSARVSVLDRSGHVVRTVRARLAGGSWVADARLRPGERAVILPGGLRDAYGETNGRAIT
ncbi:MAG TPA: hypothetical protein VMZ11_04965 [Mycobacteriales bacterium]|nr:hypothetical protein [Mycobacteriales bacterium]